MKAREIDKLFDEGKDISKYLDLSKIRRPAQETRSLLSNPKMKEPIQKGLKAPIK